MSRKRFRNKSRKIQASEIDKQFHEELGIHVRVRDKELFAASKDFSEKLKALRQEFTDRKSDAYKKFEAEKNNLYKKYAALAEQEELSA